MYASYDFIGPILKLLSRMLQALLLLLRKTTRAVLQESETRCCSVFLRRSLSRQLGRPWRPQDDPYHCSGWDEIDDEVYRRLDVLQTILGTCVKRGLRKEWEYRTSYRIFRLWDGRDFVCRTRLPNRCYECSFATCEYPLGLRKSWLTLLERERARQSEKGLAWPVVLVAFKTCSCQMMEPRPRSTRD